MAYTPNRIAKIKQKLANTHEALQRDPNVNYYEGWFFVTLNTRNEVPVLSWCVGDIRAIEGQSNAPRCEYTEVGKGVLEAWQRMAEVCDTVEVDICEAMPEHFHGLVHLLPGNRRHLGSLISGFMSGCSHAYWDTLGIEWRRPKNASASHSISLQNASASLPSSLKNASASLSPDRDRDHTHSLIGPALFVHGFNDMEPLTPEEVEIKRAYVREQARKRLIQGNHHECFIKHRHQHSKNWTEERCMQAIAIDRTFRYNTEKLDKAMANVRDRLLRDATLPSLSNASASLHIPNASASLITLDYIGNKSLLYSDRKLPLVCHSADIGRFEEQKAAVLKAAREQCIIVSAFISEKERNIKKQLMVEQLPFIEITDNGYSDKYKGIGKAFYALAENRLLQITPWQYQYHKDGTQVSREMCLVMNELARVISCREDDWWKD